MLRDDEIVELFRGFLEEGLVFLKVPRERWPEVKAGAFVNQAKNKVEPLYRDFRGNRILIHPDFHRVFNHLMSGNDGPTLYRATGYSLARQWWRYVNTGIETAPGSEFDFESTIFAEALSIIKGVPIPEKMPDELVWDAIRMLKNEFGIECTKRKGMFSNGRKLPVVTLTDDAFKAYLDKYDKVTEAANQVPTPRVKPGEKGSKENPFDNVDEAADFILKMEKELVELDPYLNMVKQEPFFHDTNFRITWASPLVSYLPLRDDKKFVATQLTTRKFAIKPTLSGRKFLFRGQNDFYFGKPCVPSLFRSDRKNYACDNVFVQELELTLRTHPLVKLFEQGFEIFNEHMRFKIEHTGLSQHYYNKTGCLDLTSEMEVAKFFAVTKFDMESDRYQKYDGNALGVLYYYKLDPDAFRERPGRPYHVSNIGKQPFMRSGNQAGFLLGMEKGQDFKEFPEVGWVFFKHDPEVTERIYAESDEGDKYQPEELLRTKWHNRVQDKDKDGKRIISYEAFDLNCKMNRHMSKNEIRKALAKEKIFVKKNYVPRFTEEELDIYYSTALETWQQFCDGICFYSPEGLVLEDHLRNLPNDKRYRWAFYRK